MLCRNYGECIRADPQPPTAPPAIPGREAAEAPCVANDNKECNRLHQQCLLAGTPEECLKLLAGCIKAVQCSGEGSGNATSVNQTRTALL